MKKKMPMTREQIDAEVARERALVGHMADRVRSLKPDRPGETDWSAAPRREPIVMMHVRVWKYVCLVLREGEDGLAQRIAREIEFQCGARR